MLLLNLEKWDVCTLSLESCFVSLDLLMGFEQWWRTYTLCQQLSHFPTMALWLTSTDTQHKSTFIFCDKLGVPSCWVLSGLLQRIDQAANVLSSHRSIRCSYCLLSIAYTCGKSAVLSVHKATADLTAQRVRVGMEQRVLLLIYKDSLGKAWEMLGHITLAGLSWFYGSFL